MVHIYEKKPITHDNEYGIEEIEDKDVFKKGPCVIFILAETKLLSSINGAMRLVTNIVNPNIDNVYDPNRRVLGLGFGKLGTGSGLFSFFGDYGGEFSEIAPTDDELAEFVNNYFLPLISSENKKIDTSVAMKNVRNVNFVTYCDGVKIFKKIEEILETEMQKLKYSDEEIKMIISQVCLAAIVGNSLKEGTKATSLLFADKKDPEFKKSLNSFSLNDTFTKCDNYLGFLVEGDGKHDLRKYMIYDLKLSSAIKTFINNSLENSIFNNKSQNFSPLHSESFIASVMRDYAINQESEIKYETYKVRNNCENSDYLYKLYRSYKNTNDRVNINSLIQKLGLSLNSEKSFENNDRFLEIAYKDNEVLAFCKHHPSYSDGYEIELMVCSKPYRGKGIATNLLNRALYNINEQGFDSCIIETSKEYDNYKFWLSSGATKIRTRKAGIFEDVEVLVLEISNIKERLDNLDSSINKKLILKKKGNI